MSHSGMLALLAVATLVSPVAGCVPRYFADPALQATHPASRDAPEAPLELPHGTLDESERAIPSEPAVARYTCPMHPEVVSEAPGSCPICGMTLVPTGDGQEAQQHEHREEGRP